MIDANIGKNWSKFTLTEVEEELVCGFLLWPPLDDLCFIFEDFIDSVLALVLATQPGIDGREKEDCWLLRGGLDLEFPVKGREGGGKERGSV